jgi:hypothetical protein
MDLLYENTNFINDRKKKQTLIIDVDDTRDIHLGSGSEFKINLHEPLRIDKASEIYLDNFITYNCNISDTKDTAGFSLKINEFNIQTNVASSHYTTSADGGINTSGVDIHNSIIIPNEHTNINDNHSVIVHKGKKFNYVCDINPTTLHYISGKITNIAGNPIFHGTEVGNQFTYSLIGLTTALTQVGENGSGNGSGGLFPLTPNDRITGYVPWNAGITLIRTDYNEMANSSVLGYLFTNSGTFNFSASTELALINLNSKTHVVFRIVRSGTEYYLKIAKDDNINLIKSNGRFLAEFCIISKD